MMTREKTELCRRRDDLSREGGGNRSKIAGLRFRLEEAETRCSHLTDEVKAFRFDLRAKGGFEVDIRRELEDEADKMGVIKAD